MWVSLRKHSSQLNVLGVRDGPYTAGAASGERDQHPTAAPGMQRKPLTIIYQARDIPSFILA